MRTKLLPAIAAATAVLAATALTGCSTQQDQSDQLKVVATTTQLTDFTQQIGGDHIQLTGLLKAGASAHHFDPSAADLLALGEADVLVVNGAGLEEFIDSAVESSGFDGTIIDASDGIDLDLAREITHEAEEAEEAEAAEEDHDHDHDEATEATEEDHDHDESAEATEEEEHDHGDLNPHLWTSPTFASEMVAQVATGLAAADPANAADYEANATAYEAKLSQLNDWISAGYAEVPAAERVLVTGHDSLLYYLHDYDITFAGSLLPSFEDNAEPSVAEIDALVKAIKDSGVKAIFVESSLSPKLAQTVANEAGIEVADADALYVDSLGPEGSGAESYLDATIQNTRVILEAWGFAPAALPADLGTLE